MGNYLQKIDDCTVLSDSLREEKNNDRLSYVRRLLQIRKNDSLKVFRYEFDGRTKISIDGVNETKYPPT